MFQRKYSHFLRGLHPAKVQPVPRDETTNSQYSRNSTLTKSKYALKQTQVSLWNSSLSITSGQQDAAALSYAKRRRRVSRWRESIIKIVTLNAALSCLVTLMGYYSLSEFDAELDRPGGPNIWLKGGICTISIVQLSLVVLYHSYAQRYHNILRAALHYGGRHSQLLHARGSILQCILECALHLIVLIPEEQSYTLRLFDRRSTLTLNEFLYLGLLLRNYDSIRCAYWLGDFPKFRLAFISRLSHIRPIFLWKYFLRRYGVKAAAGLYGAAIGLCGLVEYTLRRGEADGSLQSLWEVVSAVAMSQATIGFGHEAPKSVLSQAAMAVNVSLGLLLLSLISLLSLRLFQLSAPQSDLYSSILHSADLAEYQCSALRLIQLWWRRVLLRRRRLHHIPTGVAYARQLDDFAGLQWVKSSHNSHSLLQKLSEFRSEISGKLLHLKQLTNYRGILEMVSAT